MKSLPQNPCQWRISNLLSLDSEEVHELACWAVGTLTSFRLILGRCLLALHESKGYKSFGCSSATHYGASVLGVTQRLARECKRVASKLQTLPKLSIAAERGEIAWSKLRDIVRVAAPETESYWLEISRECDAEKLRRLVKVTPFGQLPGDVDTDNTCTTEFRIAANPEIIQLFRRARRIFSLEQDKALTGAETLESLLVSFFACQPLDSEVLEEVRTEADKDLQAERARQLPEVLEARDKAEALGLLSDDVPTETEDSAEDLLAQAIGTELSVPRCQDECCKSKRHSGVEISEQELLEQLTDELNNWHNKRLRFNEKSRHTTPAQKKEIFRRDGWQCMTPGCPHESWLHIHHIKPYSEGGPTSPENLICLCSGCHRNLHDGILKITPQATGKLIFTDQSGRRLDEQANLEIAAWLDFWCGWRGGECNSHQRRAQNGDWTVFTT